MNESSAPALADDTTTACQVVEKMVDLQGIVGITLGGSAALGLTDAESDLDLHVYWRTPLAEPAARAKQLAAIADPGSVEVDIRSWGLEDHLRIKGRLIELVYVQLDELEAEVNRAYNEGLISGGYTTARLSYLTSGTIFHDPNGSLAKLQTQLLVFPAPTRTLLLTYHPEMLRHELTQIRKGQRRDDLLYVQLCCMGLQTKFFDLLFALNRYYHPGGKRLLIHGERCPIRPTELTRRWQAITKLPADSAALPQQLEDLVDELLELASIHQ